MRFPNFIEVAMLVFISAAVMAVAVPHQSTAQPDTECLSRKKQVSIGMLMYATDWDDRFTTGKTWQDNIMPYIKNESVFRCPNVSQGFGTGMSIAIARTPQTKINDPATTAMVYDSKDLRRNAVGKFEISIAKPARHAKGNPVGYADGHCKFLH